MDNKVYHFVHFYSTYCVKEKRLRNVGVLYHEILMIKNHHTVCDGLKCPGTQIFFRKPQIFAYEFLAFIAGI